MCIEWDIPTMGTPAREVQLQKDKEDNQNSAG